MRILKQSTAANVMLFMTDSADHVTGKTGLTLTITASKDGAAFATISPTVTDRGNGWYSLALTTAHTDTLGDLALHVTGTGADPTDALCRVVAVDLADATAFGLSRLDAAVSSRSTYAGADTAGTTTLLTRVPSALTITGGAVTVGTNNDKTGYSLSALGLSAISSWTVGITGNITGNVSGSVGSVTAAVTLPGIPANWITAAGINAGALNGKGDWLLSSGYTTPPTTAAPTAAAAAPAITGRLPSIPPKALLSAPPPFLPAASPACSISCSTCRVLFSSRRVITSTNSVSASPPKPPPLVISSHLPSPARP